MVLEFVLARVRKSVAHGAAHGARPLLNETSHCAQQQRRAVCPENEHAKNILIMVLHHTSWPVCCTLLSCVGVLVLFVGPCPSEGLRRTK